MARPGGILTGYAWYDRAEDRWSRPMTLVAVACAAGVGALAVAAPAGALLLAAIPATVLAIHRPYYVVVFLILFIPVEDFVLKFLPGSDTAYAAARFLSELLLYVTLGYQILRRLLAEGRVRRTPLDGPLAAFLAIALLSVAVNHAGILASVVNLRALLRYVALYYLVVNLGLSERRIRLLLDWILVAGAIQVLVGALQLVGGDTVNRLLLPRATDLSVGDFSHTYVLLGRGREIGSVYGAMGDTILYGLFLVVVFAVLLARTVHLTPGRLLALGVLGVFVGLSYSRACVFALVGLCLARVWFRFGWRRTLLWGGAAAVVLGLAVVLTPRAGGPLEARRSEQSILQNVTAVFSRDYLNIAQKQRLAALLGNVPTILTTRPLLGFGPDESATIERLNSTQSSFLLKVWDKRGYKDVYWSALLSFYGLAGLAALSWLLRRLFRLARRAASCAESPAARQAATTMVLLIPATVFLLFLNRALEFRPYSLFFWLIAGLVVAGSSARLEDQSRPSDA